MGKKKSYNLRFVKVEDRAEEVIRNLAKNQIKKVLDKHGVICHNLDEVVNKYITEETCNGYKKG